MSLLDWIGRKIKLTDGSFWRLVYGGDTYSGKSVTVDSALTVSAFWSGVRLISQTIATLPAALYEAKENGREAVIDDPLYDLIHNAPNADQTAVEFWEGICASLCVGGNGYAEKKFAGSRLSSMIPMPWHCTRPYRTDAGELRYKYTDRGKEEDLPADKVLHVRGFGFGGDLGLSPLAYARQTLGSALAVEEASARLFANGMRPGGFFTTEKLLSPEQRAQAKEVLVNPYKGSENAGKIGILEAGFKWQDVMMPPEEAQMLQTRAFNVEEVCRWLGVPPVLVGHAAAGQTMWGSGIEQIMIGWLTLGLRPYLKRVEAACNRSLIAPADRAKKRYIEWNVDGLLRADTAARAAWYSMAVQNGIMTRNEARSKENLPAMDGGDELTVQSNLVPIGQLGENAAAPAPDQNAADSRGDTVVPFSQRGRA